jgi:hypothetical protein
MSDPGNASYYKSKAISPATILPGVWVGGLTQVEALRLIFLTPLSREHAVIKHAGPGMNSSAE